MKSIIWFAIIILVVVLGVYVGFWLMFIGGIIQVINVIKNDAGTSELAVGVLKIIFAIPVGGLLAYIPALLVKIFLTKEK